MQFHPPSTLGVLFRERRTAQRLTMREAAGTMLSPTAVNNIEKGKINPTVETVLYLCGVLHLAPEIALIHYPDFTKSAPALLEIVDRHLAEQRVETCRRLLFDMCWLVSEQERYHTWLPEIQLRLGLVFALLESYGCAKHTMNQAYEGFLEQKNIGQKLLALYYLGRFEFAERKANVAIAYYRRALDVVQRYQYSHRRVGDTLYALGEAYLLQLDPDNALRASLWAEQVYREVMALDATAHTQLQQAQIHLYQSRFDLAEHLALQAKQFFAATKATGMNQADRAQSDEDIQLCTLHSTPSALGHATRVLGDVYAALERWDEARTQYAEVLDLLGSAHCPERFEIELGLAEVALRLRDVETARTHIQTALDKSSGMQVPKGTSSCTQDQLRTEHRTRAYRLLARCEQLTENREGYLHAMTEACTTLHEGGDPLRAALLQTELAEETNDWELMCRATQTLRRLHEPLR